MKIKLKEILRTYGSVLTEVPGWPDAPVSARIRRSVPVALPCLGMLLLLIWNLSTQGPRERAQREALEPLILLESQVSTLRLAYSQQQADEIAERAEGASKQLLTDPSELPDLIRSLKKVAAAHGWEAHLSASDTVEARAVESGALSYLPVHGKLKPIRGNADAFASFLQTLERFSSGEKRIDLLRLTIRADEHGWQLVETDLRVACAAPHAKIP